MTVKELIERLQAMPPDAPVFVAQGEYPDEEAVEIVLLGGDTVAIY
jgi:hypothetical protein